MDDQGRHADPSKGPARSRSDAALAVEIRRVYEANFRVYGVRKPKPWIVRRAVWKAWKPPTRGMGRFTRE